MKLRQLSRAALLTGALLTTAAAACDRPAPSPPPDATPLPAPLPAPLPDASATPEPVKDAPAPLLDLVLYEQARTLGAGTSGVLAHARSEDPGVRARAARAMGRIGDATALDALSGLTTDDDDDVRAEAAFAIGLIAADNADDKDIVARARALLAAAWEREADRAAEGSIRPRRMVLWALRKVGGATATSLSDILGEAMLNDSPGLRAEALVSWALLSRFARDTPGLDKPELLDAVVKNGRGTAPEPRYAALYAMMRRPLEVFVPVLTDAVNDATDPAERAVAIRGLTANKSFQIAVMERLLLGRDEPAAAPDPDPWVRVEVVRNLAADGSPAALVMIDLAIQRMLAPFAASGRGLDSADFHVLLAAVEAAANAPKPSRHLGRVVEIVRNNPNFDRSTAPWGELLNAALLDCAASTGLDKLAGKLDRVASCGEGAEAQLPGFARIGRQADLIAVLPTPALDRARALEALYGTADSPQAAAAILYAAITLLPEAPPDPAAKPDPKADRALAALRVRLDALGRKALADKDPITRAIGLSLIGKAAQPGAVETLRATLAEVSPTAAPGAQLDVLMEAMDGLATAKDVASIDLVGQYLGSPTPIVRSRAATTLKKLGVTEAQTRFSPDLPTLGPDQLAPAHLLVQVETTRGPFRVELWPDVAPVTAHSFERLVGQGYYDRLSFHRVIADFVTQGGDPRGDGNGGPGYTLSAEWSAAPFARGVLGMAHAGKDTAGSQFFVTHSAQPHLDGGYTVFGKVVEGMEVVDRLQVGDKMTKLTVLPAAGP